MQLGEAARHHGDPRRAVLEELVRARVVVVEADVPIRDRPQVGPRRVRKQLREGHATREMHAPLDALPARQLPERLERPRTR
jgi:hypothetical protein